MNKKSLLFVLTVLVVGALLASCGSAATPAPTAMPAPTTAPAATAAMPAATTAPAAPAPVTYTYNGTAYTGSAVSSVPADLVAACQKEGMMTIIATPDNWANYGEIFADFQATVGSGVTLNSLDPNAGSGDELAAIEANKGNNGPQAPDIVDVGYAYGAQGVTAGDYQPYEGTYWSKLPQTTLGIPTYDPNGMWTVGYYGR